MLLALYKFATSLETNILQFENVITTHNNVNMVVEFHDNSYDRLFVLADGNVRPLRLGVPNPPKSANRHKNAVLLHKPLLT